METRNVKAFGTAAADAVLKQMNKEKYLRTQTFGGYSEKIEVDEPLY